MPYQGRTARQWLACEMARRRRWRQKQRNSNAGLISTHCFSASTIGAAGGSQGGKTAGKSVACRGWHPWLLFRAAQGAEMA